MLTLRRIVTPEQDTNLIALYFSDSLLGNSMGLGRVFAIVAMNRLPCCAQSNLDDDMRFCVHRPHLALAYDADPTGSLFRTAHRGKIWATNLRPSEPRCLGRIPALTP